MKDESVRIPAKEKALQLLKKRTEGDNQFTIYD